MHRQGQAPSEFPREDPSLPPPSPLPWPQAARAPRSAAPASGPSSWPPPPLESLPLRRVHSPLAPAAGQILLSTHSSPLAAMKTQARPPALGLKVPSAQQGMFCPPPHKTLEYSSAMFFAPLQQSLSSLGFPVSSPSFLSENCLEQPFMSVSHQHSALMIFIL